MRSSRSNRFLEWPEAVWSLTRRDLRRHTRSLGFFLTLLGAAAMAAGALVYTLLDSGRSTTGRPLLMVLSLFTALYISLQSVVNASQLSLTEDDREAGELLILAGMGRSAVLASRTLLLMIEQTLLVLIPTPIVWLAITLGGVETQNVLAILLLLVTAVWLSNSLALAVSIWKPARVDAGALQFALLVLYLSPRALPSWIRNPPAVQSFFQNTNLGWRLIDLLDSDSEPVWHNSLTFSLLAGAALLAVAWLGDIYWQAAAHWLRSDGGNGLPTRAPRRRRRGAFPIREQAFHSTIGGAWRNLMRIAVHALIFAAALSRAWSLGHAFIWAALGSGLLSLLEGAWTATRVLRDEVRQRTWPTLALTSTPADRAVADLLHGWLLGLTPAIAIPVLEVVMTLLVHEHISDALMRVELGLGTITTVAAAVATILLIARLSLDLGRSAAAVVLPSVMMLSYLYLAHLMPWGSTVGVRLLCQLFTGGVLVLIAAVAYRLCLRKMRTLQGAD